MPDASHGQAPDDRADSDADRAVTALYGSHYQSLVRLAALLVPDAAAAEQVVQDSFAAMHSAWNRLDGDQALDYLHRSVVLRSRRVPRHRAAAHTIAGSRTGAPAAAQAPDAGPRRSTLTSALRNLPARQREVLVLRYYADLPDPQIAAAMHMTTGAVGRLAARALASLPADLPAAAD